MSKTIATQQDYRIGAVFTLGAKRPISREIIEGKLTAFAGMKPDAAHLLAGHWFGTFAFKAVRS